MNKHDNEKTWTKILNIRTTTGHYDFLLKFDPNIKLGFKPSSARAFHAILAGLGYNHMDALVQEDNKEVVDVKVKRRGIKKSS